MPIHPPVIITNKNLHFRFIQLIMYMVLIIDHIYHLMNESKMFFSYNNDRRVYVTTQIDNNYFNASICNRASHLRRLQILSNTGISDKGLSEFFKRFSQLEELKISHCCNSFSKDILEVIGQCCPLLKSLNLERLSDSPTIGMSMYSYCKGDEAFCIAKTMSGLRHLKGAVSKLKIFNIHLSIRWQLIATMMMI